MTSWEGVVFVTTGSKITNRSSSSSKFVKGTLEISLECMGLLVSDPALFVLVEVVPGVLKVGFEVCWNISWLSFVSSLEDSSGGDLSIVFQEEFLSSFVS